MSETKVNERKVVGTNVVIALGIICIILAVGLVATFAYYIPKIDAIEKKIDNVTNIGSARIALPAINLSIGQRQGGYEVLDIGHISYIFYYGVPFSSNTFDGFTFEVQINGNLYADRVINAVAGTTVVFYGLEINILEVHSDYVVLLAKSL